MTQYAGYSDREMNFLNDGGDVCVRPIFEIIEPLPPEDDDWLQNAARWVPGEGWMKVGVCNVPWDDYFAVDRMGAPSRE